MWQPRRIVWVAVGMKVMSATQSWCRPACIMIARRLKSAQSMCCLPAGPSDRSATVRGAKGVG